MKLTNILPLAAFTAAIVIPDEALMSQFTELTEDKPKSISDFIPTDTIESAYNSVKDCVGNTIDKAFASIRDVEDKVHDLESMASRAAHSWIESGDLELDQFDIEDLDMDGHHPPHPPHHGRPHKPHHPPHGPHHPHKPTKTVYELIASSKYTTKLAKLINEFEDLVEILNGTEANYTVFAPTDKAFEKIPEHGKKPSKEIIRKILAYHVSPEFYPAGRVLASHTIPSTLTEEYLGGEAQRLRVSLGLRGLTLNFYSKIVAVNIFGTNGVIHGVDSLLLPPPPASKILSLLPGEFSTLELALYKTGLVGEKGDTTGGTLFAPTNWAFKKLGPKANAFLFSSYGEKYLKALLKYHIVLNETLYSDAYYAAKSTDPEEETIPRGHFHVDLPTQLKDKSLSIDIGRFGRFINIRINGYTSVSVQDGIAKDGVIQVVSSILIPPKTPGATDIYNGGEIEVEDLKERLEQYVEKGSQWTGEDL